MTVIELAQQHGFEVLCGGDKLAAQVTGGYCGDLLSHAMSHVKEGDAFITVMGNVNAVAVASLTDAACIILADNMAFDDATRAKAETHGICVLRSSLQAYDICLCVAKALS